MTDLRTDEVGIALTFVNGGTSLPDGVDRTTPDGHVQWIAQVEGTRPVGAASPPPDRRRLVDEAGRLRASVRHLFEAVASGRPVPSHVLHTLNRAQGFGSWSTTLHSDASGLRIDTTLDGNGPLVPLAALARAAAVLVTTVPPGRLRECAADDCVRWFVDSSKGGRRRWCSMATCGNRAKAARYRARHPVD